jgi:hypothetical protein
MLHKPQPRLSVNWCSLVVWWNNHIFQGPYTETIDLCFEPFFVKEIMRELNDCKRLKRLTNEEQHF